MTYCIAWRTTEAAFIAADSVVTSAPQDLVEPYSSFGERHLKEDNKTVQEGALKVLVIGNIILSFVGDARLGFDAANVLWRIISTTKSSRKALETVVNSITPYPSGRSVHLLFVYSVDGEPRITSFDGKNFQDHKQFIQFGSINEHHRSLTQTLIRRFTGGIVNPRQALATTLGVIQSYGVRDALIPQGVGGAFCGAYVDRDGAHAQPDICYMLYVAGHDEIFSYGESVVSSYRSGVFVVRSSLSVPSYGHPRCFTIRFPEEQLVTMNGRVLHALEKSLEITHAGTFDFVVFINKQYALVTVIEMRGNSKHQLLLIEGPDKGKGGIQHSNVRISDILLRYLIKAVPPGKEVSNDFLGVHFVPYSPFRG